MAKFRLHLKNHFTLFKIISAKWFLTNFAQVQIFSANTHVLKKAALEAVNAFYHFAEVNDCRVLAVSSSKKLKLICFCKRLLNCTYGSCFKLLFAPTCS